MPESCLFVSLVYTEVHTKGIYLYIPLVYTEVYSIVYTIGQNQLF